MSLSSRSQNIVFENLIYSNTPMLHKTQDKLKASSSSQRTVIQTACKLLQNHPGLGKGQKSQAPLKNRCWCNYICLKLFCTLWANQRRKRAAQTRRIFSVSLSIWEATLHQPNSTSAWPCWKLKRSIYHLDYRTIDLNMLCKWLHHQEEKGNTQTEECSGIKWSAWQDMNC